MGIVYFVGGEENEQATGAVLDSGSMKMYAIKRNDPTKMIYLGGHRVDEAFNYNVTERKISPEYLHRNGRNILVERTLTGEKVKSITFNVKLPNKVISVTNFIAREMNKGTTYDIVFVPSSCEAGCDEYFWHGEDLFFGVRKYDSAPVGFDENEAPITSMREASIVGDIRTYRGLVAEGVNTNTGTSEGLDLYIVEDNCTSGCPYQTVLVGGAGTVGLSTDGGVSFTQLTTTAITVDLVGALVNAVVESNGNYVVGYSDTNNITGTDGGFAYSIGGAAFVLSTLLDEAGAAETTLGINKIVKAFGKLIGVGTGGEVWTSCDDGVTWVLNGTSVATIGQNIYDAAFDSVNNLLYLACDAAEAWVFDGSAFYDITTEVGGTAAVDLLSVAVTAPGAVVFGAANGRIYENFTANDLSSAYTATAIAGNAVNVLSLAGDGYSLRTLSAIGDSFRKRDVLTNQAWATAEDITGYTGNITRIKAGKALSADEGVNFFYLLYSDAMLAKVSACNLCFETVC